MTNTAETKIFTPTKEQSEAFAEEVRLWIDRFGLHDWRVTVETRDFGNAQAIARLFFDSPARAATITLNACVDCALDDERVSRAAFHEVAELLLVQLSEHAHANAPQHVANEHTHAVIRRLERAVWEPNYYGHPPMPR